LIAKTFGLNEEKSNENSTLNKNTKKSKFLKSAYLFLKELLSSKHYLKEIELTLLRPETKENFLETWASFY
jgi:hypothetical protein